MPEGDEVKTAQEAARLAQRAKAQAGAQRVISLLERTRGDIVTEVADSEWDQFILPKLLSNVDRALEDWRGNMTELTQDGQIDAFTNGAVHEPVLSAMDLDVSLPAIPDSLLQTFQQDVGARIGGLKVSAKRGIDRIITEQLIGGGSREDAIEAIGRTLSRDGRRATGHFKNFEARARFIYQHEVGSVYATAQYYRQVQAMQWVPELQRVWRHLGHPRIPRQDHIAMHGQEAGREEDFVNPVTGAELRFPRDPNADIKDTANCTCDVVLWRPLYGDKYDYIGAATGFAAMDEAA